MHCIWQRSFTSRLFKDAIMMPTTNGMSPINLSLMKNGLGVTPALNDVS
jgi:hypothetical protein